jgi:Family of unknown function (DUF6210)
MSTRRIRLSHMPRDVMLIIGYPSGVVYENQVGGVACSRGELEGVLVPVGLPAGDAERFMALPFPGAAALNADVADRIDEILASVPFARYLKVDRNRLRESCEAWVFVLAEIPADSTFQLYGPYFGAPRGFGPAGGVLTWPNSD